MGEFVESQLEQLLPVFEYLGHVSLFTSDEVASLVKRCRRYEYRLQKKEKTPDDFKIYADYLKDVVTLVRSRRARMNYWHKMKLIDRPLLLKIASVLRRCCDRFQGRIELWKSLFHFLSTYHMRPQLSKAYTSCLQIHGRNIDIRCQSALWEFFSNASADNARTQLMLAQRVFPKEPRLFDALFNIEVHFVSKIMQRREFLKGRSKTVRGVEDEEAGPDESVFDVDVEDSVLQLRVAQVVSEIAMKTVDEADKGGLLLSMWRNLIACPKLPVDPKDRIRQSLEDQLTALGNEFTELLAIDKAMADGKDVFEAYDEALLGCPNEGMCRKYLEFCESRTDDPFADTKRGQLLAMIMDKGWAAEKDLDKIAHSIDTLPEDADRISLLTKAVEASPTSAVFWAELIKYRLDNEDFTDKKNIESMLTALNTAFEKVPLDDAYPLWELAIDFAAAHHPSHVETFFERAYITASTNVKTEVKILRLEFLENMVEEKLLTEEERKKHVRQLFSHRPSRSSFYKAVVDAELALGDKADHNLIKYALDLSVSENGTDSIEAWMTYCQYLMKFNPMEVATIYKRALLDLDKELCPQFIIEYTKMQQEEATRFGEKELKSKSEKTTAKKRKAVASQEEEYGLSKNPAVHPEVAAN